MEEAMELAMRGRGHVEPNPRVGAVALQGDEVVGRGWHRFWGGPHAEVEALADARVRGASPDTMVVTLEPCSSPQGLAGKKMPPCTDALVEAGIQKVIVGARDDDRRHGGHGLATLQAAGVEVVDGVLADRCRALNAPFHRGLELDRPWTILKWAMTLDGKTAAPTGESRWISGKASRTVVHELRSRVDAVVVGYRTARIDDPSLTVRHVDGPQPIRIVVDPFAELETDSRLITSARQHPLWMLVNSEADRVRLARLEELGVTVIPVPPADKGRRLHLLTAWRELRRRGIRRMLCEGGGSLSAQLMSWGCVDQTMCFVAPKMIGGQFGPSPLGGSGKPFMAEAWRFDEMYWEPCGEDLMVGAFVAE